MGGFCVVVGHGVVEGSRRGVVVQVGGHVQLPKIQHVIQLNFTGSGNDDVSIWGEKFSRGIKTFI